MIIQTIGSVYPLPLRIDKPNITPGRYNFKAASEDNISFVYLRDDVNPLPHTHIYGGQDQGYIQKEIPLTELAHAIVQDFLVSCMYARADAHPGLFHVSGEFSLDSAENREVLKRTIVAQDGYFREVIKEADRTWAQLPDPTQIDELHRMAAKYHGVTREWSIEPGLSTKACEGCGTVVRSFAVICPQCSWILRPDQFDPSKFAMSRRPSKQKAQDITR